MADTVRYELRDDVAIVTLDDGKVNALSRAVIAAVDAVLDRAEDEAKALVLAGRPGRFSGGFDLGVMGGGGGRQAVIDLVGAGGELAMRLYEFPRPTVAACTGHAIAMGAFLVLACDLRVGADGDFKIGLNEVANGMTVPIFGIELARERLSKRHLTRAVATSEIYAPAAAVDAGFFDTITAPARVVDEAYATAQRLTALVPGAFARTRTRLRDATIRHVRSTLAADMRELVP